MISDFGFGTQRHRGKDILINNGQSVLLRLEAFEMPLTIVHLLSPVVGEDAYVSKCFILNTNNGVKRPNAESIPGVLAADFLRVFVPW